MGLPARRSRSCRRRCRGSPRRWLGRDEHPQMTQMYRRWRTVLSVFHPASSADEPPASKARFRSRLSDDTNDLVKIFATPPGADRSNEAAVDRRPSAWRDREALPTRASVRARDDFARGFAFPRLLSTRCLLVFNNVFLLLPDETCIRQFTA